jgi:hypothetical protein
MSGVHGRLRLTTVDVDRYEGRLRRESDTSDVADAATRDGQQTMHEFVEPSFRHREAEEGYELRVLQFAKTHAYFPLLPVKDAMPLASVMNSVALATHTPTTSHPAATQGVPEFPAAGGEIDSRTVRFAVTPTSAPGSPIMPRCGTLAVYAVRVPRAVSKFVDPVVQSRVVPARKIAYLPTPKLPAMKRTGWMPGNESAEFTDFYTSTDTEGGFAG